MPPVIFLWIYTGKPAKNYFCTSYGKITISDKIFCNFFLSRFPFRDNDDSLGSRKRKEPIFIPLWTFRRLFATLNLKRLPRIFNHITSNYQTTIRRALSTLGITIWLIVNGMLGSVYLRILHFINIICLT